MTVERYSQQGLEENKNSRQSNSGLYSSIIKIESKNGENIGNKYKQVVMGILKSSLEDERNKRKLMNVNSLIKKNRRLGKKMYYSGVDLGMYKVQHNNKGYYITPFLCIEYSEDGNVKVLYWIKDGKDTIKVAKQKLKYIGLDSKVSEIIETMSLQSVNHINKK